MQNGPVQGDAAHGFDRPYARDKAQADKELKSSLAGEKARPPVPRDDTEVKNPDSELYDPAPMPRR